jgi:hypothetical protein
LNEKKTKKGKPNSKVQYKEAEIIDDQYPDLDFVDQKVPK